MYGCESRIQAAEMMFLLKVKGCTQLGKFGNEDIRTDLQILSINNRILVYKHQWFQHERRVENDRLPEMAVAYRQT
jgi:hypothetical protein